MATEDVISLVDDENVTEQLSSIENKLSSLIEKLSHPTDSKKFELIDRNDLKQKISSITSNLVEKNFSIIKKYLQSKSNPTTIPIQETSVRLLTLCIQQSFDHAKQISSEFNYFNETKNWLEKFLLIKKSDLREMSVEFLLSFLKYTQPPFNTQENFTLIKKIFLKSQDTKSSLTLISCLFAHITSDSKPTINYMFKQLLYGIIQNPLFSKSDKIRFFSDHILSKIIKLYAAETDEIQEIQEIVSHFLKSLFTSTRFGISFYDKTMGLKSDNNLNHLIFNQLIALDFNKLYLLKHVKELFLSTLKLCPDLIQRLIKVKLKQLGTETNLFYDFLTELFKQSTKNVKNFQKFLQGNENETFLIDLILATSLPMAVNFQRDLCAKKLDVLLSSLNCIKEWKNLIESEQEKSESLKLILENSDSFMTRLNLELLSKHLPKFEQLGLNYSLITAYVSIFEESLNLSELEQVEFNLSEKLQENNYAEYIDFLKVLAEIKFKNNFDVVNDKMRKVLIMNLKKMIQKSNLLPGLVLLFKVYLKPSESVKFDDDFMYLYFREMQKNDVQDYTEFFEIFLCQKKRSLILLDRNTDIDLNEFINLIKKSDDYLFNTRILAEDCEWNRIKKRIENIKELVGKKSLDLSGEKIKIKTLSEAFMFYLRDMLDLETIDLNVKLFNWSIRSRLLVFLLSQVSKQTDGFDTTKDFNIILTNFENCVETLNEFYKLENITDIEKLKINQIIQTLLNNKTLIVESFKNENISQFVLKYLQIVDIDKFQLIESYVSEYVKSTHNESFILELDLNKTQFDQVIAKLMQNYDLNKSILKANKNFFKCFVKFLIKNKSNLIDTVGIKFLDKIDKFKGNFGNYLNSLRFILLVLKNDQSLLDEELVKFLSDCELFEPKVFDLELKLIKSDNFSESIRKKIEDFRPKEHDIVLKSSKSELIDEYKHTLAKNDIEILKKLKELDADLNSLLFSRVSALNKSNDLEQKQIKMNDFITLKLDDTIFTNTIRNFPINRKLDQINIEDFDKNVYDPVYLLPNFYELLDYANIVDVLQFIQSKCLSYLLSSLSSQCSKLRSIAYGSIYRFISHLENSRVYCKNIITYLLTLLRNSIEIENQRLSSVISVFLAEAIMILIEPGSTLYKPLVSFFLIKPVLDLTNVPEFYKLFNSSSLEFKTERKWILSILSYSCRSSLEYRLFEKRFIYRQLLSIYDSKISDLDVKMLILDILLKTCSSKFALIDLIKKHYFLIWMTSVIETMVVDENRCELFLKLIKIYSLIWKQLGKTGNDQKLPLGFLNQMFILMKVIKLKLGDRKEIFENLFADNLAEPIENRTILEAFFRQCDELIRSIEKYEFSVSSKLENRSFTQMIEMGLVKIDNGEIDGFDNFNMYVNKRMLDEEPILTNNKKLKKIK